MRRGGMRTAGWTLATAAMIGLSWYGVHSVLAPPDDGGYGAQAAAGPPSDLVSPASDATDASPGPSASHPPAVPSASAPPSPSASAPPPTVRPAPTRTAPAPPPSPRTGEHTYTVPGGSVVLDLAPASATLVSATPRPGWAMQDWQEPGSIRVVFYQGQQAVSSVTCTWNGHPPQVRTYSG